MGLGTPLHDIHVASGARMVDFGGWDMPLHYGSQIGEHAAVRRDAGMFDVSHMAVADLTGGRTREFLRVLLANDVAKLHKPGKALYSCMLLPDGGVIDDLIAYFLSESWFRLVVNAGTRDKDLSWIRSHAAAFDVEVAERGDLAMIAVQGPNARAKVAGVLPTPLREAALAIAPFCGAQLDAWFVARTGYTGEDGFEIMLPAAAAADTWRALAAAGVTPAGLGARDTLRLEAGMNLYGNDMDEAHHPLESGLAWTVSFADPERPFIGRAALELANSASMNQLVGLLLEGRGVLRAHQRVITARAGAAGPVARGANGEVASGGSGEVASGGSGEVASGESGEITSGTFSPTLNRSIALARLPSGVDSAVQVDIRGTLHPARIVKPPFVRHGQILIQL
jgi:aminomethyltransferase